MDYKLSLASPIKKNHIIKNIINKIIENTIIEIMSRKLPLIICILERLSLHNLPSRLQRSNWLKKCNSGGENVKA